MKEVDVTARGAFDMYARSETGRRINKFLWETQKKPVRLTNFNLSIGFDLKKIFDNYFGTESSEGQQGNASEADRGLGRPDEQNRMLGDEPGAEETPGSMTPDEESLEFNEYGYADFSMPWSLRVAYNLYYRKSGLTSDLTQNMTLNGSVTLTDRWAITYATGYDFKASEITMTRVGIQRDLHCWQMSFNWVPTGYLKSWDFTIRVKSSVLQDLKYERRKDFHDNSR